MKLEGVNLLTDENVHPVVVRFLVEHGHDVLDAKKDGLIGTSDRELVNQTHRDGRVIVTHDRDFEALALTGHEPPTGIVYILPGHLNPAFTIGTLRVVLQQDFDLTPPFVLVADRDGKEVRMRLRRL